jgi:ATP-binding cassette subfamily B protein
MPLKEELPETIKELLEEQKIKEEEILLALQSDLNDKGQFSPTWFIATKDKILVISTDDTKPKLLQSLPLKDYKFFKAEIGVGGGFFSACSDGYERRLLRFTTATARKFQVAANALGRLVNEGHIPPDILAEEESKKVCPRCGFPVDPVSGICPQCSPKGAVVRRLLSYIKPYYPTILILVSLLLLGTAFDVISPLVSRNMIDKALVVREPTPTETRLALLKAYVLLMAGLGIGSMLLGIFQQRIYAFLGNSVLFDIRRQLFEHLQFLSVSYYDKRQVGAVMSRVTQDTSALQEFLGWHIPFLFSQMVLLLGIGAVMISLNWRIALLVLVPTPLVAYLTRVMGRKIHHLFHRVWDRWSKVIAVLNSALSGIRVVKAFAQEEREAQRFRERAEELTWNTIWAEQLWATYMPPLFFLFGATPLLVWYFGGKQLILDPAHMSMGTLQAFISYTFMILGPIQAVTRVVNWLTRALAATERIFEILDTPPEVLDEEDAISMPKIEGRVEFRNVTFGYDKFLPVLHNVSFEVQPGEIVGLVGRTGAGKTTIINLICRFYEPQEGQILIDGVDIRKIKLKDLRNQIAIVPQDAYVFAGTVRENIAYGKPDATLEEIIEAAKAANAHEFIMNLPYGYDTPIGERGVMISGGERQRIAIARAILKNPRILILDEATSLVDTETEKQIQEALDRLMQGRTVFAIAHRLSTLSNAHRLIVIEDGRIAEMGTHKELLQKKGIYYQLVKLQREMSRLVAIGV